MLERITIGEQSGVVTYLDEKFAVAPKSEATLAKVVFDNGTRAFYKVSPVEPSSKAQR